MARKRDEERAARKAMLDRLMKRQVATVAMAQAEFLTAEGILRSAMGGRPADEVAVLHLLLVQLAVREDVPETPETLAPVVEPERNGVADD